MPVEIKGNIYYTTQEATDYLGVSRDTIYNLVNEGRLTQYKQGIRRQVYYLKTQLDEIKEIRPVEPGEE